MYFLFHVFYGLKLHRILGENIIVSAKTER